MKDDPSMVQEVIVNPTNFNKSVRNIAQKQEKKDKADGSWYSHTGDPSKYFAHGKHGYAAGYYNGHYYLNSSHPVSAATVKAYYNRCAKKYYAHHNHARKQARKGEHAKAQFNSNFYVYNPKKFGKKGYDMMYTTGFNTKRGYKSHFKRSNNSTLLKKSGFKDLRKYGANFIFNKYAPNNPKAVVPKGIDFTYTDWYQGRFGQNHPKVFADYGHNTWYLHK